MNTSACPSGRGAACVALFACALPVARAEIIEPGFDLFRTDQPTTFQGVPFECVPIPSFDFGGTAGVINLNSTDTIVRRITPGSGSGPGTTDTIDIEMVALQLRSVDPVDFGGGVDFHFVTLNGVSLGSMDVTFDSPAGGTFDAALDVSFDLRIGSLTGPIVLSDVLPFTVDGVPWGRTPSHDAFGIDGVNSFLNGLDRSADFWPDPFSLVAPGAVHSVSPIPAPGAAALGALALGATLRRRR